MWKKWRRNVIFLLVNVFWAYHMWTHALYLNDITTLFFALTYRRFSIFSLLWNWFCYVVFGFLLVNYGMSMVVMVIWDLRRTLWSDVFRYMVFFFYVDSILLFILLLYVYILFLVWVWYILRDLITIFLHFDSFF